MSEDTRVQDALVESAVSVADRQAVPGGSAPGGSRFDVDLFEGPLDLLLHLIKKNEVDIANIPVAAVTEQYLGYLDLMRELNLDVAGEFLVMAATLMLVKSRMLLPAPETEEGEDDDPRADLVRQLLEYSRYRDAAAELADRPRLQRDVFVREPNAEGLDPNPDELVHVKVTLWQLMEAFQRVLKRAEPDPIHEVEADAVRVRDRIDSVLRALGVARKITFASLFGDRPTRGFVISTFLAILELGKLGAIDALQDESFGEILIVLRVDDVSQVQVDLEDDYEGGAPSMMPSEV